MPPLYPKMRERPMEFRINYDAPLADGLVFAGLGGHGCVGSMVYPDSSLYANHGTLTNMDAATDWVWCDELKRFGLYFNNSGNAQVQLSRLPFHTGQGHVSIVTWLRPLGYTSQSAIFGEYKSDWTRNYLYVTRSTAVFDQYPPAGG